MSTTPPDYDAQIGANLRTLRLSYTVKQTDLAARLGVQRAAVTRWEQGTRGLTVGMLLRIADTFGIPASRLLPEHHRELGAAAASTEQHTTAPQSLEESAIASIAQVLRERPELIVAVMQFLEQQALASDHNHTDRD
jgi:transcriptional regulator with XRE-family HTH domain